MAKINIDRLATKNSEHCSLFLLRATGLVLKLICIISLASCQPSATTQTLIFSGPIMGTDYKVKIVVPTEYSNSNLEATILAQLQAVNASMSTYLDDSEVSRINRLNAGEKVHLSPQLREVIAEAIDVSELSHGAFDITVARLVNLWGFGPDGEIDKRPSIQRLDKLRASTGISNLILEGEFLTKKHSETQIDLSAIAKGYAVDQVATMLEANGIVNYLINVGGELRAKGKNIDQDVWRIAIEKPEEFGGIQQLIELHDMAIATSGDYRNYLIIDGEKYSHTINPATLEPVLHRIALVSVVDQKASRADALATALMAMGEKSAIELAENLNIIAYFVIRTDLEGVYDIKYTQKFASYLQ